MTVENTVELMVLRILKSSSSHAGPGSRELARFNSRAMAFKGQSPMPCSLQADFTALKGHSLLPRRQAFNMRACREYIRVKP